MKYFTLLLLPVLMPFGNSQRLQPSVDDQVVTTYYLIRHAEKDRSDASNSNPDLNESGVQRAMKWSEVFKDIPLNMIFSTDYNRTRQTAGPTAKSKDLEVIIYDASKLFTEKIKADTKGKNVLIVGHSNTTPQFVNMILEESKYENIDDSENGALFIVQVLADGSKTSKVLYIN